MIDSHCHLDHEPLLSDLPNVIKRSKDVGIKKLLTISTSLESFSRVKNNPGAAIITTGPGGTNCTTGVASCWIDSVPAIFISIQMTGNPIPQLGFGSESTDGVY